MKSSYNIIRISLIVIFVLNYVWATQEELLMVQYSPGRKALLVKSDSVREPCWFYGHDYPIEAIKTSPKGQLIRTVDQTEWTKEATKCQQRAQPDMIPFVPLPQGWQAEPITQKQFDFIYPGTKWCGPGNVARHYEDLGPRFATDRCCRDHDYCFDTMPAGTCKYGLCNNSPFAKSHCDCDELFRQCLIASTDPAGFAVGFLFFDIAAVSCYKQNGTQCPILPAGRQTKPNPRPSWCFEPARPFKKSTIAQQLMEPTIQQEYEMEEDGTSRMDDTAVIGPTGRLLRHFVSKVGEVKSLVKNAALTSLIDRHIKG